ncbi:MAG: TrkH family potassium uptake protein [Phycisphaerae bacterium]|nr:TrkH family potassium uptake protein [Phycisphaerae bacterium]
MNVRYATRVSALSLLLVTAAMVPVGVFAAVDSPAEGWASAEALGTTVLLTLCAFAAVWLGVRHERDAFGRREAFLMVGMTWLLAPVLAGCPFFLWAHFFHAVPFETHPFQSPVNCYFESMSGLTTTGASILSDIEAVPRGLLLWRSTTHWLGGLGIVLLFVAVLPMVGATGKKLHFVESSGPSPDGIQPRIRDTARVLWISYTLITLGSILALHFAGLPWFNAFCETFGAIATGGFSVRNQSIDAYDSGFVEAIIVAVMILGAINFSMYFQLARGRWRQVWRDSELRLFLALIGIGAAVVILSIRGSQVATISGNQHDVGWLTALRYGIFNLVSMHTDTGFATADFDRWPFLALAVIVFGTFIGGSAGSTTGGIKVVRLFAAVKILYSQLQACIRPGVVQTVRIGRRSLDTHEQISIVITILLFVFALAGGTFALMLIGADDGVMDLTTAFSASLANLCTAGPGFAGVGPDQNYLWLPNASKLVLCFLMLIGRLEIVPILALMHLRFWKTQ